MLEIPMRNRVLHDGIGFDTEELPGRRQLNERGVPDESLIVGEDRGLANVVVWVRSRNVPVADPPEKDSLPPVQLRAVNGRLVPHVLVFWNVASLELVNDSGQATNFNILGMQINMVVADGRRATVDARRRMSIPSSVRSNIHPWLNGYVLALDHPYFSVTGEDGRFKIVDLPAGKWDIVMWHERTGFLESDKYPKGRFTMKVAPGKNDLGDAKVAPMAPAAAPAAAMALARAPQERPDAEPDMLPELHRAAMTGDLQRVRDLLRIGMSANERDPRLNGTPLHYAARHGHAETVRALLDRGASVDARDINNCTPLMWAAKGGHEEAVRALLDADANIDAQDNRDWTALHFAADRGHGELVKLLVERGADRNARNRNGKTPFELKRATAAGAP
jgi:hypothetical protein